MLKTTNKENYNKKRTIKENLGKDKEKPLLTEGSKRKPAFFSLSLFSLKKQDFKKDMEQAKVQRAEREPPSINAFEGVKVSGGVLEMIPPEYWRRLRRELNALDWESINAREAEARRQAEQAAAELAKAQAEAECREKRRRQLREAQMRYRERHKNGKGQN